MAHDRDKPPSRSKPPSAPTNEKIESYKLKWGFIMCCVGAQDGLQVENRLTSVEKYLDNFVVEFEDGKDVEMKGETGGLGGTKKRFKDGVRVAVEIHPLGRQEVFRSTGDADDGLGSCAGAEIKTGKENNKRRKSLAGEHNVSKPRDAIRVVDDRSDSEIAVLTRKPFLRLTYRTDMKN
ncbi:MAG: hypothetical protein Q9204_007971 [Flavoplaca sp. TL-2023a]